MSIFVTGDIHASYDIAKLSESCFDTAGLTKDDYVIICGDFGLVWNNSASEQYWLRWLDARPFTTLFVDGNHEGFSLLNSLPETTWNGGAVHQVATSVLHLKQIIDSSNMFGCISASRWAEQLQQMRRTLHQFGQSMVHRRKSNEQERATARSPIAADWDCDIITIVRHRLARKDISSTPIAWKSPMDEYTDWLKQFKIV